MIALLLFTCPPGEGEQRGSKVVFYNFQTTNHLFCHQQCAIPCFFARKLFLEGFGLFGTNSEIFRDSK